MSERRKVLHEAFLSKQDELKAQLRLAGVASHAPTIGDGSELNWKRMLGELLPERYAVTQGFVIDSHDSCSNQIDLIIHDRQYSPLFFTIGDASYIPAESVYAVFEVKQDLSKEHIEYAGRKIESVRSLRRTAAPIVHAGGVFAPRPLPRIIGGILATSSGWTEGLGEKLRKSLEALTDVQQLDLGCAVLAGAFVQERSEDGILRLDVCSAEMALVWFAVQLLRKLQAVGTVPAIDYSEYLRALE